MLSRLVYSLAWGTALFVSPAWVSSALSDSLDNYEACKRSVNSKWEACQADAQKLSSNFYFVANNACNGVRKEGLSKCSGMIALPSTPKARH